MSRPLPQVSPPGSFWSLFDRPVGWIFFIFFLGAFSAGMLAQNRFIQGYKEKPWTDSFALPQPEYVKRLALGYDAFMADMLFLRSIQAFGGVYFNPDPTVRQYAAVFNYFDVISELDPHFIEAYTFGNLVMGDEGQRHDLALQYLRKGWWNNWRRFEPWYDSAYIKVYGLKEQDNQAKLFVRQAAKSKDAPEWAARLEFLIDEKAGQFNIALLGWVEQYATAIDNGDKMMAGIARNRFGSTVNEWHKKLLQDAIDKHLKEQGRPVNSLEELELAGYLPPVEVIDIDLLMQNLAMYETRQGKLAPYVDQIFQSSLVPKPGILANLSNPADPFVIVCYDNTDARVITTQSMRDIMTNQALQTYRDAIQQYYNANNAYPPSLEAIQIPGGNPVDPYCAGWRYDPNSGLIVTPAREDL